VRVLLLTGSTRGASTNTAALRTAIAVAPDGVECVLYGGLADLPAFNPDDDHDPLPAVVGDLRAQIAAADALLICTPEYAGALPGSFKNLLDWTVGGTQMTAKPTAWINVGGPGRGENAYASLAIVLGYVDVRVIEAACRRVPVRRDALADDGTVDDPEVRATLADVLRTLVSAI
jgi:NAD(P)H-dependent FMN reductase